MAALKYWIWLSDANVSTRAKAEILRRYGDAEQAFFAPTGELAALENVRREDAAVLERRDLERAERVMDECQRQKLGIITYDDRDYPARLKNIFAPPVVLYVRGALPRVDDNAVIAIVGTRRATDYGVRMARAIAGEIVRCGGIVASGLTAGIDAAGAVGALGAGGTCIGVLGTAHELSEGRLAGEVAEYGALVSEYAPGSEQRRSFFRDRNRVTAGLSVGAVAVEAPERSGTRLFIEEAAEQGKEIFSVPPNSDAAMSAGTLGYLKDGAKLVTRGWDVMSEFEWRFPGRVHRPEICAERPEIAALAGGGRAQKRAARRNKTKKVIDKENNRRYIDLKDQLGQLSEPQLKIVNAIAPGGSHIDDIIETTGLTTAAVLAQLTVLEIKGFVRREAGRRIMLNTAKK